MAAIKSDLDVYLLRLYKMQFSFKGPFKELPIWVTGLKISKKYSISTYWKTTKKHYLANFMHLLFNS